MLVRIPSASLDAPPVYLDSADVTGIHPAGIPGCSVVARRSSFVLLVQGTPDDVHALLFPPPATTPEIREPHDLTEAELDAAWTRTHE